MYLKCLDSIYPSVAEINSFILLGITESWAGLGDSNAHPTEDQEVAGSTLAGSAI